MTIYQEPKENSGEYLGSKLPPSSAISLQNLESELEIARHRLEQAENVYEAADEAAFNAAEAADQGEKIYHANHDQMQALRAEEDSMRTATELAGALAADASNLKTDGNTNYSGLLNQAMTALITVSSNAEQELEEKHQQRIQAEYNDLRLRVEAASATLSSYMAARRRDNAGYERLQAFNQFNLKEIQYKLALVRSELSDKLNFIAEQRTSLDDTIADYYAAINEAERLTAEEEKHKTELDELQQHLATTSTEIIPYETLVNDLKHEETLLYDAYNKATRKAEEAYQQQNQASDVLQIAIQAEQAQSAEAEQKFSSLVEKNQQRIQAAESDLAAAKASLENAQNIADQAKTLYEEQLAEIPILESENSACLAALDKARVTAGETARMVTNVQAAKSAMKDNSTNILSSVESVLQNTLQAANDMVREKEQAYNESCNLLEEKKKNSDFLLQAAEEAKSGCHTVENTYQEVQKIYQQTVNETRQAERELRSVLDQKGNEVHLRRVKAAESLAAAEKITTAKLKATEDIDQRIRELHAQYENAVQSRDNMQQQINELNAKIREEKMQETVDRERQIITLWEESEELHLNAKETGQKIKRTVENVYKLSHKEQQLTEVLRKNLEQAQASIVKLYQQTTTGTSEHKPIEQELREALAAYQAVDDQDIQESVIERDAALRSAAMILEACEIISAETMQEPEDYAIEIGEPLLLDPDLVLLPIPQIEGDTDIELDPLAIEDEIETESEIKESAKTTEQTTETPTEETPVEETQEASHAPSVNPETITLIDTSPLRDIDRLLELQQNLDQTGLSADSLTHSAGAPSVEAQPVEAVPPAEDKQTEPSAPVQSSSTPLITGYYTLLTKETPLLAELEALVKSEREEKQTDTSNFETVESSTALAEPAPQPQPVEPSTAQAEPAPQPQPVEPSTVQTEPAPQPQPVEPPSALAEPAPQPQLANLSESRQTGTTADVAANLLQDIQLLQQNIALAEAAGQKASLSLTKQSIPQPIEGKPLDKAQQLAAEISSLRSLLSSNIPAEPAQTPFTEPASPPKNIQPEAEPLHEHEEASPPIAEELAKLETQRKLAAEEAARKESERIRAEEELAQQQAEALAATRAEAEQQAAVAESERLARLAEEATQQLSIQQKATPSSPSTPMQTVSSSAPRDEEEDDLEAELRRLIFNNFQ